MSSGSRSGPAARPCRPRLPSTLGPGLRCRLKVEPRQTQLAWSCHFNLAGVTSASASPVARGRWGRWGPRQRGDGRGGGAPGAPRGCGPGSGPGAGRGGPLPRGGKPASELPPAVAPLLPVLEWAAGGAGRGRAHRHRWERAQACGRASLTGGRSERTLGHPPGWKLPGAQGGGPHQG